MTSITLEHATQATDAPLKPPRRFRRMFETEGERARVIGLVEHRLAEVFEEALAWSDQVPPPRVPVWVDGRETAQEITTVVDLLADSNWFTEEVLNALRRDKLTNLRRSIVDCYVDANSAAAVEDYWTGR